MYTVPECPNKALNPENASADAPRSVTNAALQGFGELLKPRRLHGLISRKAPKHPSLSLHREKADLPTTTPWTWLRAASQESALESWLSSPFKSPRFVCSRIGIPLVWSLVEASELVARRVLEPTEKC